MNPSTPNGDIDSFLMSFQMFDIIQLSPCNAALEKVVVETVTKHWSRGMDSSQHRMDGKVFDLKLNGRPWAGQGTGFLGAVVPLSGPLVMELLKALQGIGFRAAVSIDLSIVDSEPDSTLFRRVSLTAMQQFQFALHLVSPDFLYAYDAPPELLSSGIEESIRAHWSPGLQAKETMDDGSTRFKLRGNFLRCRGISNEGIEARLFVANLIADFAPARLSLFRVARRFAMWNVQWIHVVRANLIISH